MNPAIEFDATQIARDGDLVDDLSMKSMQLQSLLVTLMHALRSEDVPRDHIETTCWLACDLAGGIYATTQAFSQLTTVP